MSLLIPTRTDGTQAYSQAVQLDGIAFRLDFSWNGRGKYWKVAIYDAAANLLLSKAIRVGMPLLARYRDPAFPPGEMVANDTSGQDADPGVNDLGARVQLVYYTAAEMAVALA